MQVPAMSDLLSLVLRAHGGVQRWLELKTAAVIVRSGGEMLDRKAPQGREPLRFTISLHEQSTSAVPVGNPERRILFRPDRVAIEKANGELIGERINPRASFEGHDLDTKWDPLHRVYFSGYAMWIYLNAPFMLIMPEVQTEEIAPLEQNGETWRGLQVTLPANLVSHSSVQKFYFGGDFLLRRQDYTLEIVGGRNVAHYVFEIKSFDGLLVATKRRAYLCDDKYNVLRDRLLIWLDLSDIEFR